ncbi:MAG: sensor histidine kinase, partial [Mycobacterium sp.]
MTDTSDAELYRVRRIHQLRSYRIASVVRIGVVGLMVAAMIIGTERSEWPQQSVLIIVYAFIALCAVARAFSPFHLWWALHRLEPFAFNVIDVVALTVFQL